MMDNDDRQFLLTAAWLFARHGQGARARTLCEALVEDDSRDGVSAGALAVLRAADTPPELARAEALLEARALAALGKADEAAKRWRRHLESAKGGTRQWI